MGSQAEQLLRSALEKIVFFECRVEAIEAELTATRAATSRAQEEATRSRTRQVDVETALAEARGALSGALAKNAELLGRVQLLEDERERFMTGLIEQARLSAAPSALRVADTEGIDLGGFMAELRGEVHRLRGWKEAALSAGITLDEPGAPRTLAELRAEVPASVPEVAARFAAAGRIGSSRADDARIESLFATRAERALYESSMADLSSSDTGSRLRAVECLRALGSKAAAPLVASAIGREPDEGVKAALLAALASLASDPAAAELAVAELADARPRVRVAALQAFTDLAKDAAIPRLCEALADPSAPVRRRAAMCLGYFGVSSATEALVATLGDKDAGVARTAALALSGRPSAAAQAALVRAIDHKEPSVRRIAADAVARWGGGPVDLDANPAERRRAARRVGERLRTLDPSALRSAVFGESAPAARHRPAAPRATTTTTATRRVATATIATVSAAPAPALDAGELSGAIVQEIRASLRGRSAPELASSLAASERVITHVLERLVSRGTLVLRGARFFAG